MTGIRKLIFLIFNIALALQLFCASSLAQPVTIDHRWGRTVIDDAPQRVITLSFIGVDALLALDVVPLAYRTWYGGDEKGLWPWTAEHMPASASPIVFRGDIDIEAVARLRPDFVEAMYSGLSQAQFSALTHIVPVLPSLAGAGDFGTTWKEMLESVGKATGRSDKAHRVITNILFEIEEIRNRFPEWEDKTAVVAQIDGPLIFSELDPRSTLLRSLGFQMPESARARSAGNFYFKLDRELTEPLDADVVIWLSFDGNVERLNDLPLRATMKAVQEGREIVLGPELSAALSYASPLSIPFALKHLVPKLDTALRTPRNAHRQHVIESGLPRQ